MRKLRLKYTNHNINNVANYSAFGMQMKGRTYNATSTEYGFNGKIKDSEIYGDVNACDYGFRFYDIKKII